jgi:hypothetical protein
MSRRIVSFAGMKAMIFAGVLLVSTAALAQGSGWRDTSRIVIPELKYKFNASGTRYIKATALSQTWARYSELNPGSTIDGTPKSAYGDIGIRRWRIQAFGQITDRIFFYTQFGQNNFSFLQPRHTGAFLHDAVTEYKVFPQLQLGGGLTGWSGMSRYSSPAVASILGIDAPLYQQATNGINEQFVRKLSLYAKGQISKLDYRIAIASPMSTLNSTVKLPATLSSTSSFNAEPGKMQTSGYLFWQFFDKENNAVPYTTGTYLGKKKVLNIGAGWVEQRDAMWHTVGSGDTVRTNLLLLGADIFADLPVGGKGAAVTAYGAFNYFDFGPGYLRMNGAMNPANGVQAASASLNGAGVNYPMIGTGNILFAQAGYKFRDNLLADNGTLQPYASVQYSQFDALDQAAVLYEGGVNWLIHGTHGGKISLGIQNRPVFGTNAGGQQLQTMRKNMYLLQYQIAF